MAKWHIEDILHESFKNKKCDKIKIQLTGKKFHPDELSNYYYSRFPQEIKYLEFNSVK